MAGREDRTDILIVGGGLMGCAATYYLAKAGAEVLLVERGDLNSQASGATGGSLHAQIPTEEFHLHGEDWGRAFLPVLRLMTAGVAAWQGLSEEIGTDLEVSTPGGLVVAETEAEMAWLSRKAAMERDFGIETEMLDRATLRDLAPYLAEHAVGAAFCKGEGKANALLAAPALALAAERHGARLRRGLEVTDIARESGGYRVETTAGPIRCARLLNAAGTGARRLGRMVGIDLPVRGYPIHMNVTEPTAPLVRHLVYSAAGRLTIKQAANGTVLIGGGWPAGIDPKAGYPVVLRESIQANLWLAMRAVPALAGLQVVRTWAGFVNGTEDWRPILGEAPGLPGYFVAAFPWFGFTAGPLSGRLMTDLILGRDPGFDLASFAPNAPNA
ncbi:MAG: FAD-binding oxidoreductase [Proteobacteria bacterium]|nr:FAD-binding oxidoreductase [Pseudomonadota bacterium]